MSQEQSAPKNVFLIGSTGMIGSRIASEARSRGIEITEATRSGGDNIVALDASNPEAVSAAVQGQDAIVMAVSPPRDGTPPAPALLAVGRGVIQAARLANVPRVVVVGGAGSLKVDDSSTVVEQSWFPEEVKPEALAHGELLELFRSEAGDLDWTYLSPPGMIAPGERTGSYATGIDYVVADQISAEDYAVALVDELEASANIRRRFAVGAA